MAWIVRNLLRGTLTLRGLPVSIRAKAEADLDALLGREKAEASNQVIVAFEEGYLETVRKDAGSGAPASGGVTTGMSRDDVERALAGQAESFRASMREDLEKLRTSLAGDVKGMLEGLKVAKAKIAGERQRLRSDGTISDAEIRARLASLDEQERELEKNFREIGKKHTSETGSAAEKADLLSSL